jgi:hypothetical protein
MGILPRTIWPAVDSSHRRELRARQQDVKAIDAVNASIAVVVAAVAAGAGGSSR